MLKTEPLCLSLSFCLDASQKYPILAKRRALKRTPTHVTALKAQEFVSRISVLFDTPIVKLDVAL
jgi:hypothetical protein